MPKGKLLNGLVTQQKVLRAAVALFLEKGYTKTTTGEIATAAGIGQSSFFHVFPSKEALLLELVKRMFGGQFDLAEQHSGEDDPVFLYAVETALQLHIAELSEPLRERKCRRRRMSRWRHVHHVRWHDHGLQVR